MSKINDLIKELCPNGVKKYTIKDICLVTRGRVISKMELQENIGEYPVYSSQTLNNGVFGKINTYDFEGQYVQWTTDGANAGSIFYRNGKFSVTNVCGLLKVKDEYFNAINTNYLSYALTMESKKYVNYATSNPKLMSNVMERITVLIPPIEIQEEIVRILDKFGELEAELEARKSQYEFWRGKLFEKENVKYMKISEFAKCCAGATPSTSHSEYWENGTIPWMSSGEVNNIEIYDTEKKITELGYNSSSTKMLPINTVVVALAGQGKTRGLVAIIRKEVCTNQSLCGIVPDERVDNEYLFHYLQSRYKDLRRISSGDGTRGGLNLKMINDYEVPVPSIDEQKKIINVLNRFSRLVNLYIDGLPAEIELRRKQYEYYRNMLLNFEEVHE